MSNNSLPPQDMETYVKLDDDHNVMYSSIDTTMSGSMYQQQQQQPSSLGGDLSTSQQPIIQSTMIAQDNTTTTTGTTQQRGILESMGDSLNNLVNSMSLSSTTTNVNRNNYLQPQYNSTVQVENPETMFEYTLDAAILDCQMVHPTQLGQTSCRITIELMIQHKTIPTLSQKLNKNEIGGSATYRPDLKLHVTAMDKNVSVSERIESLVNADPQRSLQNFFVYVILKKTKNNLLDIQKIPIAFSPCFTLADFIKPTNNEQQQPMYSFDLFKDQQMREHVGKLGIRLSISMYSDYQYVSSLPSGFFASKAFTVPTTSKTQRVSSLLTLTEKVKKWLNSYSSLIRVIEITTANDGKELAQVVLYQKL